MSGSRLKLSLTDGGEALIEASDGEHVRLRCARAFPPGSTLRGSNDAAEVFSVKVRQCRRVTAADAGGFRVEGRFVSLGREQRRRLLAALAP